MLHKILAGKPEGRTCLVWAVGLIAFWISRSQVAWPAYFLALPIYFLIIHLLSVMVGPPQMSWLEVLEGCIGVSSVIITSSTPFGWFFLLLWSIFAIVEFTQLRRGLLFAAAVVAAFFLVQLTLSGSAKLLELLLGAVALVVFVYRLSCRRLQYEEQQQQLLQEIEDIKKDSSSQQKLQDEKMKELLAAKVSMEEKYAELYTLQIINDVANSELSIDILGEKAVDILTGLTGSIACSVIMLNEEGPPSILATSINKPELKSDLIGPEAESLFRQILAGDNEGTAKLQEIIFSKRGARSVMVVPLRLKTGGSGIILAEHAVEHAFNTETYKILMNAADRLAMAIDNARLYDRMERMAVTDALTGVYNRLYLHQHLTKLFSGETLPKLALSMFDVDHFKKVNDTYGHLAGDATLKQLTALVRQMLPPSGMIARYGGEEFVMIVPNYDLQQMIELSEQVRLKVQETTIIAEGCEPFKVTISLGVSSVPDFATTAEGVLGSADEALYKAKQTGRNRVCTAE